MISCHVTRLDQDGVAVLTPVGEFDIGTVDLLRSAILAALEDVSSLVLDLAQTTFLDSMALGTIISSGRRAREAGGWVRLVAPQPNIRRTLKLTEMDRVFGLYDSVDQALAHDETADEAALRAEVSQ